MDVKTTFCAYWERAMYIIKTSFARLKNICVPEESSLITRYQIIRLIKLEYL